MHKTARTAAGKSIADRLRRLRKRRDWTQTELAEALHVSQEYVSQLENEVRGEPSGPVLALLEAIERDR